MGLRLVSNAMPGELTIVKAGPPPIDGQGQVVAFDDVKGWFRSGSWPRHVLRYHDVRLRTARVDQVTKPFLSAVVIRGLSRGRASFEDPSGGAVQMGPVGVARLGTAAARDFLGQRRMLN